MRHEKLVEILTVSFLLETKVFFKTPLQFPSHIKHTMNAKAIAKYSIRHGFASLHPVPLLSLT